MKAIGLSSYGGPQVLHVVDLPEPHAGPGEVRVRVRAAGVNPADLMLRDGSLADWHRDMEPPFIPGMDVAGTIDEIADDARPIEGESLSLGTDVVGIVDNHGRHGGYSEYVVLPAESVTRKPAGTTFPQAASFLMNALTARCALDALALAPGATLVVTGPPARSAATPSSSPLRKGSTSSRWHRRATRNCCAPTALRPSSPAEPT